MLHRFSIARDGKLEEIATQQPNQYDEMAQRVISLVTSGGAAANRIEPFDRFAQGVRTIQDANDGFTQRIMAASRPVAAKGFDRSRSGNWLGK